jgi:hypothetical protein
MAIDVKTHRGLFFTLRKDAWWLEPLFYIGLFGGFTVYATWAALNPYGHDGRILYQWGPYLSPMFSPFFNPAWLHHLPVWLSWLATPALLVLWAPGGFRGTCYYYRKAYYRSIFLNPPGCAVGEGCVKYEGETKFFIFQNLHRYFMYIALIFIFILSFDAVLAMLWPTNGIGPDGQSVPGAHQFGIGVGTLVMTLNAVLLGGYTLGCHAFRHLVGGGLDFLRVKQNNPARFFLWSVVTHLNEKHMQWALVSMIWVGLTDLYIRLCAMGVIHDFRIF